MPIVLISFANFGLELTISDGKFIISASVKSLLNINNIFCKWGIKTILSFSNLHIFKNPVFISGIVNKNGVFVASVCQHKKGSGMVKDCCIKNFNAFRLQQASSSATDKNEDEKKIEANEEKLGNLVADDEWLGLTMELTELVRLAIVEDVKKQTRDFIGKDNYKVSTPRYIIYVLVV